MTRAFVLALGLDRVRRAAHGPGRVAVDLAVLLADGGEAISDLAVLRQQPGLFGRVASDPTVWRVLDAIDASALHRLRAARAAARELAWAQLLETRRWIPWAAQAVGTLGSLAANVAVGGTDPIGKALARWPALSMLVSVKFAVLHARSRQS